MRFRKPWLFSRRIPRMAMSPRGSKVLSALFSMPRHAINARVSDAAIILDSLEKWFPPALSGWRAFRQPFSPPTSPALRGISLQVKQGEAAALLGGGWARNVTLLPIL